MGYYIGDIVKLRNKFFEASEKSEFSDAIKYGSEIVKLYRDNNDRESLEYANDVNNLAIIYDNVMSHKKAIELYREAAGIRGKVLGENSLQYADTLSNMAVALSLDDRHTEAFQYHRKALKIREANLESDSSDVIMSLYNLGSACEDLDKPDKAAQYYEMAMNRASAQKKYPKDDYADIIIGYARVLYKKGNYKKSSEMYDRALEILKEFNGDKGFFYISTLNDAAAVFEKRKVYPRALECYKKIVELRKKLFDKTHLDYITNVNSLASVYRKMGDFEEAVKAHTEALALIKSVIGDSHPFYAEAFNNIALDYLGLKDFERAIEYAKKSIELKKESLGPSNISYAVSLDSLGKIYMEMGRFKEAEERFNTSRLMRRQIFGDNSLLYADALMNLARLFKKQGKYEKAAEYYYEALKIRKSSPDGESMEVSVNLYELSELMTLMKKQNEALSLNQKALDIRRIVYGKNHPRYAKGLYNSAKILAKFGKYDEALKKLTEALKMQGEYVGEESEEYKDTLRQIIDCRLNMAKESFSLGEYQRAMEYYNMAVSEAEKNKIVGVVENEAEFAPIFASVGNISKAMEIINGAKGEIAEKYGECSAQYAELLKNEGKTYIFANNLAEAEKKLVKCLETEYLLPENGGKSSGEISIILGDAFRKAGDMKKAMSYYSKVSKDGMSPDYPAACYGMAKCCFEGGNTLLAKEYFIKAKDAMENTGKYENKMYSDTTWTLGKICEKEKNLTDAERYCNISICTRRLLGDKSVSYLNDLVRLANIMKKNGNKSEAINAYNEAASGILSIKGENEEYAKLITKMAKLNVEIGRNEAAETMFKKSAETYKKIYGAESDEYAAALYDLLLFCVKTGKAMQAAENVQSLMQIVEKNISSRFRDEKYDLRLKKLYEKIQKM